MDDTNQSHSHKDRRSFLKTAASLGAAGMLVASEDQAAAGSLTQKEKLARLASNTWPIRYIFKIRGNWGRGPTAEGM